MKSHVRRLILILAVFTTLAMGCSAPLAAEDNPQIGDVAALLAELGPDVSVSEVAQLYGTGDVVVIDVREVDEYAGGHIPGAILMPLGTVPQRSGEIPVDQPVIVVCRTDNRSAQAVQWLRQQGFTNVHRMFGGMVAWEAAGNEIEQ